MKRARKKVPVIWLVLALVAVVFGGVLFVGAASGWFSDLRVTIDSEYYDETPELMDLDVAGYDELVAKRRSFVIFVDQDGCKTAVRLGENLARYMEEAGLSAYRMMFEDVKESGLYNYVKYYPSVVIVGGGVPRAWLRADADEDAAAYNDYDALVEWIEGVLR